MTNSVELLRLWFFRDLSSEQRNKLFSLAGYPVDEIGDNHGRQTLALKHFLAVLRPAGDVQAVGEAGSVPGSNGGFTMAVFDAAQVPIGSKVYLSPPSHTAPVVTEEMVERIAALYGNFIPSHGWTGFGPTPDQITAALGGSNGQ